MEPPIHGGNQSDTYSSCLYPTTCPPYYGACYKPLLPISMTIAASQKRKKSVVQLSADGSFIKKWDFISDAAKALNIDRGDITKRCKDGNKAKGFRWMYETEYLKQKDG